MRFDRFVSALALSHFSEALSALFGPEMADSCRNHTCNSSGQGCPGGCRCVRGSGFSCAARK